MLGDHAIGVVDLPQKAYMTSINFEHVFHVLPSASMLVDGSGSIICANQAAADMTEYPVNELKRCSIQTLMPELYSALYANQSAQENAFVTLYTKHNQSHRIRVDFNLIDRAQNNPILITLSDDRRRRAEESLRKSEERLKLAKRAAGLGLYDRDLTNNALYWDEHAREIWGLNSDEEISYQEFESLIHPGDLDARKKALNQALDPNGDGQYHTEFRIFRKHDGAERWIASIGKIAFEHGKPVRLLGLMRDITDLKILENQSRIRRNETESLLKQQIALHTASAIAHEINQPLAAISAYSEVALHSLQSKQINSDTLCHALEGCVNQAQRAGDSLHELLHFLKQTEFKLEPTCLSALIPATLEIAKKDANGDFKYTLSIAPDLPPVLCSATQVQKVILNLIYNAIEAVHMDGKKTALINIEARADHNTQMAIISVQDNGPGMDEHTAHHIFEPFFTTKARGIGMGLVISRSIIEANGGKLWLAGNSSAGTCMQFTLPLTTLATEEPSL